MSNTYKSFAVVGAGDIGTHIVNAFVSVGVHPIVLSRKSSSQPKDLPSSITVVKVEGYDAVDEVAAAFKGHNVEVVVSAIGTSALELEYPLAEAAKKAGVKLFVPSEYGLVTEGVSKVSDDKDSVLVWKDKFAEHIRETGLPFARFFVGLFFGYVPWITAYEQNGKVNIFGKGDQPVSFTDEADIGGYVVYVLTNLPPKQLENACFRIEGDKTTMQELAKRLKKEIAYVEHVPGEPLNDLKNRLVRLWDAGKGSTSWDYALGARREKNDNGLWPGHKWKTFADIGLGL
ncbi:endo- -beta-xylanase precursor [Moniliophthora roreri MCA 2997]|uniref:Endo--beta-xylanase n=1 Tax=Moniliophthora roreri (strain MCA 2997) TaxID=1381753 RepID=V2XCJ1_MONRO|nr:endo- -beta-xylanase precursor [Moniliophthora roreri MCA 2997]